MALLWCDGFDHYGSAGNTTEGPWAQAWSALDTTIKRTGTHSARLNSVSLNTARRVFGGPKTTVGVGYAMYVPSIPTTNNSLTLFSFRDAANAVQVSVHLQSTGVIEAFRGVTAQSLGVTATPVIVAEAWQHVECMVTIDNAVGMVEVRVNGVTVLAVADVDTAASANIETSQFAVYYNLTAGTNIYVDDMFCYDNTGSYNNSFLGDRRVLTLFPDADTADTDWSVTGAANGYQAIDDATPDGDSTYISSATVGDKSGFSYQDLPAGISNIAGVVAVHMSRKTDAGPANIQTAIKSGASESLGADRTITERYTYWQDVFETDPASAAPFTPTEVNDLTISFERTL